LSTARAPPRTRTGYGQYESYTLGRPSGSRLRDLDGSLAEEKVIDPVEDAVEAGEVAIELGLRHSEASLRYRIAEGANRTAAVDLRQDRQCAPRQRKTQRGRPENNLQRLTRLQSARQRNAVAFAQNGNQLRSYGRLGLRRPFARRQICNVHLLVAGNQLGQGRALDSGKATHPLPQYGILKICLRHIARRFDKAHHRKPG